MTLSAGASHKSQNSTWSDVSRHRQTYTRPNAFQTPSPLPSPKNTTTSTNQKGADPLVFIVTGGDLISIHAHPTFLLCAVGN